MSEGKTKQRTVEYDLARTLAIVAVVAIHCFAFVLIYDFSPGSKTWLLANLFDSVSRWCVPVFIMLSGALLIKPGFDMTRLKDFYKSKVSRVVVPFVIWATIYVGFYAIIQSRHPWRADLSHGINSILEGKPIGGHLYFILIIIGLYAITPFLSLLVGQLSRKVVAMLAGSLLIAASISLTISMWVTYDQKDNMVSLFVPYIGYYLLGYVINSERDRLKARFSGRLLAWLFMANSALIAVVTYGLMRTGASSWTYFYEYLSPFVITLSLITIVGLMKLSDMIVVRRLVERSLKLDYKQAITSLSGMTFGVYFVHLLLIDAFWTIFKDFRQDANGVVVGTVTFLLVVPLSFVLTYMYGQLLPVIYNWRNQMADFLYEVESKYSYASASDIAE